MIFLSSCEERVSKKIQPEASKGILDLSDWNLKKDNPVELKGEWEFYWQQLLFEKDFLNSDLPKKTGNMR